MCGPSHGVMTGISKIKIPFFIMAGHNAILAEQFRTPYIFSTKFGTPLGLSISFYGKLCHNVFRTLVSNGP